MNLAEVAKSEFEQTPLVKVTIKSAEWATYKVQFEKKQMAAYLLGWYPDYVDPDDYTAAFAQTKASAGEGIYFSSKAWDDLFTQEENTPDPKVRKELFEKVQQDVDRRGALRPHLPGQPLRLHPEERDRRQDRRAAHLPLRHARIHEVIPRSA